MQTHALGGALAQIDFTATIATGEVVVGFGADAAGVGMVADRHGVVAHPVQPIDHIPAAVHPWGSRGAAHTEVHGAAGQVQVLRDLAAGLAAAHHQYGAFR